MARPPKLKILHIETFYEFSLRLEDSFLEWQPCHFPVMVFCSSRAIYLGFFQCPLWGKLVFLSPISNYFKMELGMAQLYDLTYLGGIDFFQIYHVHIEFCQWYHCLLWYIFCMQSTSDGRFHHISLIHWLYYLIIEKHYPLRAKRVGR